MPLDLRLTEEAAEYVRQRGGSLMLRPAVRNGCCGGTVEVPIAEVSSPDDPDAYEVIDHSGIRIYAHRSLGAESEVRVGLDRLGPWKRLHVEGIRSTLR